MSRGLLAAALAAATIALAAPSAAQADSFPLVGWWPMNEGSGQTVRDWSGKGNNGYLGTTTAADANDPSWIRGVFLGSALRFDGRRLRHDPATTPRSSRSGSRSRPGCAATRRPAAPSYVVAKGAPGLPDVARTASTRARGGGMAFYIADSTYDFFVTPAAPASVWDGKWHHVAGTFDGSGPPLRRRRAGRQRHAGRRAPIDYDLGEHDGQIGNYPGACAPMTPDARSATSTASRSGRRRSRSTRSGTLLKPLVTLAR